MKIAETLTFCFVVLLCPLFLNAQTGGNQGSLTIHDVFQSEFGAELNSQSIQEVAERIREIGGKPDSIVIRAFHLYNEETSGRLSLGLKKAETVVDSVRLRLPERVTLVPFGDDYTITSPLTKKKKKQLRSVVVRYWKRTE